ncbi:rRNA pseudouridine synthase [bacterium]|nr:rRNA pseudouridine synthase [bacterium]
MATENPQGERIHKALAHAGVGSRRQIEGWIKAGKVKVNGKPAVLGQPVTAADKIIVNGRRISLARESDVPRQVLVYRKPQGQVVTRRDPEGRETVFKSLPRPRKGRWVAVGRLDIATSGVMLFTTDGELAQRLMHPSFNIEREYAVRVLGEPTGETLTALREGVELEDGLASFDVLRGGEGQGDNKWFAVQVSEGRNRLVRRLWESQGHAVSRLIRTRFGPVTLDKSIRNTGHRWATAEEMAALLELVDLPGEAGLDGYGGGSQRDRRDKRNP